MHVESQGAKDRELLELGIEDAVVWHFFSSSTGCGSYRTIFSAHFDLLPCKFSYTRSISACHQTSTKYSNPLFASSLAIGRRSKRGAILSGLWGRFQVVCSCNLVSVN